MGKLDARPRVCGSCGSVSHVVPFVCDACGERVELPWKEQHAFGTPYPEGWVSAFQHGHSAAADDEGLYCSWECAARMAVARVERAREAA